MPYLTGYINIFDSDEYILFIYLLFQIFKNQKKKLKHKSDDKKEIFL